jgi:hypothetical protein
MAAIGAFDPSRVIATPVASNATPGTATAQGPGRQAGFTGSSSFDPVESTINGQNSQASSRSNLATGDYATKEGILGQSNAAWSWHQLRKELIALMK